MACWPLEDGRHAAVYSRPDGLAELHAGDQAFLFSAPAAAVEAMMEWAGWITVQELRAEPVPEAREPAGFFARIAPPET